MSLKILVFSQPFPMGEYHMKRFESDYLSSLGHEVYLLEQLNGKDWDDEYFQQIKSLNPDVIYFGPLDHKTYELIEHFDCKKILNSCSLGVFDKMEDIKEKYGKWYTHLFTNSIVAYNEVKKLTDNVKHYEYFAHYIKDDEMKKKTEYEHDCVFLGQGFHRLTENSIQIDRDIFFSSFDEGYDIAVYGNGWPPNMNWYKGVLPAGHIGNLYKSAKSGVAIIEPDQHIYGMINNRYSEMSYCEIPIITHDYEKIDWFGARDYINFVNSKEEFMNTIKKCVNGEDEIILKTKKMRSFIENQHKVFYEKLKELVEN